MRVCCWRTALPDIPQLGQDCLQPIVVPPHRAIDGPFDRNVFERIFARQKAVATGLTNPAGPFALG